MENSSQSTIRVKGEPEGHLEFRKLGLMTQHQGVSWLLQLKHCHRSQETVRAAAAKDISQLLCPQAPARRVS